LEVINIMKKQEVDVIDIYLRLSSEDGDKEESESISNQRKIIYDFIDKYFDYKKCYEYVDDGYSGSNFNRPAFKKMIKELKQNKVNLVITKNLARFARNYIDSGEYIEKIFPSMGIRYIAVLDGVDNFQDKPENEYAPFKGLFNEMYCRETSKNIKRTKKKKREEGLYCCPIAPYGYKKDKENPGKLIIDENVADIVRKIFYMKYEGKTSKEIAKYLNDNNIITPARYLNVFKNRDIDIWTGEGVSRLVCKPVYVGDSYLGKAQNLSYKSKKKIYNKRIDCDITRNTHEPIISREIFNAIHNNNKYNNYKPKIANVDTILGDYFYCNRCKKKMRKVNKNGKIFLLCGTYASSEELCDNNKRFKYDELEKIVIEQLKNDIEEFINSKHNKEKIYRKFKQKELKKINQEKEKLNNDKRNIIFKISSLYNNRLEQRISEEEYKILYNDLVSKREKIDKQLEKINNQGGDSDVEEELRKKVNNIKKAYRNLNINKFNKEDFQYLIQKIEVDSEILNIKLKFKI